MRQSESPASGGLVELPDLPNLPDIPALPDLPADPDVIIGTPGDDKLYGTDGSDEIWADPVPSDSVGGDDTVFALGRR